MIHLFTFTSPMTHSELRAAGIEPLHSRGALLPGYRLRSEEERVCIEQHESSDVYGVLHALRDRDEARIAGWFGGRLETVCARTLDGQRCWSLVPCAGVLRAETLDAAVQAGLPALWQAELRERLGLPTAPELPLRVFVPAWVEAAAAGPESPVRAVLKASAQARATRGDENLGYLSETHGFLPTLSPLESLSRGFSPWDDVARELPRLYRDVRVRRAIDALPELDARELSDAELLRASALLSTLAHAYWYSEVTPPQGLPRTLEVPWAEVRARLGRGPAVMSYVDLIVSNWRLKDRTLSDPLRVENMMLLFPTVGTREEQVFYLTQAEILGRCSPIVGATARAQEAVLAGDDEALEAALLVVLGCLQRVLRDSLLKINPHPDGDRSKIVRRSSQASEPEIRQKGI